MDEEIVDGSGEEVRIEDEDTNPHISVHAISGTTAKGYKTMRVTVYVRKKPLHILIDSGSTNNFLDVEIAKKLGCKIEQIGPMRVDVAKESSLACVAICKLLFVKAFLGPYKDLNLPQMSYYFLWEIVIWCWEYNG